ncbi:MULTISPECIES: serine/threonine-protein kinase [unclassified Pseudonocardia]|uniref:serine/threonine-protein kinase n=1 Tax=unclassified Pseudonocardia TaxID=2619320 RepID=UPI00076112E1|nr:MULTISPECIES: serine/threonine-protein kinase [unclassified Pseudonocardia]
MTAMRSPVPETDVIAGRYILATHIGIGSTATVYRAWDPETDRAVALKLFVNGCDVTGLNRQRRELRAMTHLHHPSLVQLHGGGVDHGRPYLVSDLVEGETLAERLSRRPLPPEQACGIGAEVAGGLAHIHARGVVHRDVKPSNILLCARTGRARLTDFGIARVMGYASLTQTGTILGTAAYLAPEQASGDSVSPAADVYALGLLLIEALTGQREYPGTPIESAVARLHRRPRVPATLPSFLQEALRAATYTRPDDRILAADLSIRLAHRQ